MIGKPIALVCLSFVWGVHGACAAPQASPPVKQRPATPQVSSAELNKRKEALASRVTELYDLAKAGQWRKMEALMTEDSKDVFYGQSKNPVNEFEVKRIEVEPDGKIGRAVVDIKFVAGGFAQLMVLPQPSRWVFDNGVWLLKLEKPVAHPLAAFTQGGAAGPPSALRFGQREIEIERGAHEYVLRFENTGQQTLAVRAGADPCQCMDVSLDKEKYAPGESGELRIKTAIDASMEPREFRVQVVAEPGPQWTFLILRLK